MVIPVVTGQPSFGSAGEPPAIQPGRPQRMFLAPAKPALPGRRTALTLRPPDFR